MKAQFDYVQPEVSIKKQNGYLYVFICLNQVLRKRICDDHITVTEYYECDYYEFKEVLGVLDERDILANPVKYINYKPKQKPTLEDEVKSLKEQNEMLIQCVLEMSSIVYS